MRKNALGEVIEEVLGNLRDRDQAWVYRREAQTLGRTAAHAFKRHTDETDIDVK